MLENQTFGIFDSARDESITHGNKSWSYNIAYSQKPPYVMLYCVFSTFQTISKSFKKH